MYSHKIEAEGLDESIKSILAHGKRAEAALKRIVSKGLRMPKIKEHTPVFSSVTKSGWKQKVKKYAAFGSVNIAGYYYNKNPFFVRIINTGRKPGNAPLKGGEVPEKLLAWVQTRIAPAASQLHGTAFAIARSIGRKGVAPRPFVSAAIEGMESKVQQLLNNGVEELANQLAAKKG